MTHQKPHIRGAFLLLMLSALLHAWSLMVPVLWWCTLFFWIPFYMSALIHCGGFWWGFAWGVVAYGLLYSFTVPVFWYYGHGFLKIIGYPCLLVYMALWSGLLLLCIKKISRGWRVVCVPLLLCGYFWFFDRAVFIGLGAWQGNPLFAPWLPLVSHIYEQPFMPVSVLRLQHTGDNALEHARQMTHAMIDLVRHNAEICVIVAPESFFPYPLNEYPEAVRMWQENVLCNGVTLCCGAYRSERGFVYNSLYCITNADMQWYDKRDLCYVTEYISWLGKLLGLDTLFLRGSTAFSCGYGERKPMNIPGLGDFVPYLCSELLLAPKLCDAYPELPILCLANDSWFFDAYMPRLMMLQARYRALTLKRPVLYISYTMLRSNTIVNAKKSNDFCSMFYLEDILMAFV